MTYLLRRGKGSRRRRAHIATYDQYGNVGKAWCGMGRSDAEGRRADARR